MVQNVIIQAVDAGVSLDTVFVRDFEDDYHKETHDSGDILLQQARQIKRRYRSFTEFYQAQSVFGHYMQRLVEKYGTWKRFEAMYSSGMVDDFLPPIPRMRDTRRNRQILKQGILISSPARRHKVDREELKSLVHRTNENIDPKEIVMGPLSKYNKRAEKIMEERNFDGVSFKTVNNMSSLQLIEKYMHGVTSKKRAIEDEENKRISIDDIITGKYQREQEESNMDDDFIIYNGMMMRRSEQEQLNLIRHLSDMGWDGIKILRNRKDGDKDKLTKIAKRQKKNAKKRKKRNKKQSAFYKDMFGVGDADSFQDFEDSILDLSSDNIFK